MLDLDKDVQGVALYAEFRKPGATTSNHTNIDKKDLNNHK